MVFVRRRVAASRLEWVRGAGAFVAIASAAVAVGCARGSSTGAAPAGGSGGGRGPAPVSVKTAAVVAKPMAVRVRVVGNVEPSSTVAVRAQVNGELLSVHFREGQEVQQGELLFTIDPRPFESALKQAEANLARDSATSKNAEAQLARSADLLKQGLVSQAQHDVIVAQAGALRASLDAGHAQVNTARLLLKDTKVLAPIAGRTGALLVHAGSLVRTNDPAPLVVINQISPVFVSFAVPARMLPSLRADSTRGALRVDAAPAGSSEAPVTGSVTFFDNAIDPTTDTIRLKASFTNRDRRLWPGAFVDVTLERSVDPNALVVPNAAVQASQSGQMVFVVGPGDTVEARPITVGWTEGDESVVAAGLKAGETVVTDGQLRLTPGAKVTRQPAAVPQ